MGRRSCLVVLVCAALLTAFGTAAGIPAVPASAAAPVVAAAEAGQGWVIDRAGPFAVAYRGERSGTPGSPGPGEAAGRLNDTAGRVAAWLGREWPPAGVDTVFRVVLAHPGVVSPSDWAELRFQTVDPASTDSLDQAAAVAVLGWASGAGDVPALLAAGVARRANSDQGHVRAVAAALAEQRRLAGVVQLANWWPSLPLGREQAAALVDFIRERWGPSGLLGLVRSGYDPSGDSSPADAACRQALGVRTNQLDQGWVADVADHAGTMPPGALDAGRAVVAAALSHARWTMRLLAGLVFVLAASVVLALSRDRRRALWCLAAFAAAATVELWLFPLQISVAAKSGVALAEVLAMTAVLAAWAWRRRRRNDVRATEGATPSAETAPGRSLVWVELAVVVALFVMIMAPRIGLYWFCREIWAKAPKIVLVLALVFWGGNGGLRSVGLGPMNLGRLAWVTFVGFVAFRLTTGLTEIVLFGSFADLTGLEAAWQYYEPWWRAIGFHHYPAQAWSGLQTAVDVWDFAFGNFAEELFFRGYLLGRLQKVMGWGKAAAVQAVLFGLYHVNYDMFPFQFWPMVGYVLMATSFGGLMALLMRYSGSLVVPSLVHPMSNLGVLWVGAEYVGYHGGWLGFLTYYPLQIALGLLFIPALLKAATGTFRPPLWLRPRARRPRGPYIEAPPAS